MASRLDRHDKKRKINKFYNIAITIVSLLIVIVAITIFTNNDVDQASKEHEQTTSKEEVKKPTSELENEGKEKTEEAVTEEKVEEESEPEEEQAEGVKLEQIEGSGDANVLNTYTSKDWQPVGTEQTGPHTTSFEKGSTD